MVGGNRVFGGQLTVVDSATVSSDGLKADAPEFQPGQPLNTRGCVKKGEKFLDMLYC